MTDLIPTDQGIATSPNFSSTVTGQTELTRSAVSVTEHRAREKADRIITAFSERFTEKGFFPQDDEGLVFALLPQLADWPADLALWLINEYGELIASWTKGTGGTLIQRTVSVVQLHTGEYAAVGSASPSGDDPEAFFQLILRVLPTDVRLGTGGNFPGSETVAGQIVTLREQLAELVRSERTQVFDALLADETEIKNRIGTHYPNPFFPFWRAPPTDRSPVVNTLLAFYPDIYTGRLEALLEQFPLSDVQAQAFLDEDELPDPFIDALEQSIDEWCKDKAIDGIFHSRTYNPDADELARKVSGDLLKERFDYALVITEPWQARYEPGGPDDTAIVLLHDGRGNYALQDSRNNEINRFRAGTDSFYQAIGSALQPHERLSLGMQSEADVAGLRTTLGNLAAIANGGWYDPQNHFEVKDDLLPTWMKEASAADKLLWTGAWEDYRQALAEAQTPDFLDISQYGSPEHLRSYARTELKQRLGVELGLTLEPDDIIVETTESSWAGNTEPPPGPFFDGRPVDDGGFEHITMRRSLTQVCLDNLRVEEGDFWTTALFLDRNDQPIPELTRRYVHGLVRELNVGDSYIEFLRQRLLTSSFGQWSRECYAQVMATQMRLDAIETKMAMGFLEDGTSPVQQADRGYKWVRAVIDHPVDDGTRVLVEGHRIRVQTLTLQYDFAGEEEAIGYDGGVVVGDGSVRGLSRPNGVPLEGMLIIAPESRLSVPGIVIYTPSAPEGVRFREFSSHEEMERHLLGSADLRDYLVTRAPVALQADVQRSLSDISLRDTLVFIAQPALVDDLYFTQYEAEVQKVIAQADGQTTSTSEANWHSAWNLAVVLAEAVLMFTPFKVSLPIAAARSLYAVAHAGLALRDGDGSAPLQFVQAILLLADGLPGAKKAKVKLPSTPGIDPKYALQAAPSGLKLRTDGHVNGVYEKVDAAGHSSFYVKDAGNTFSVRYDNDSASPRWRVINARNPRSFYQLPIFFDGRGRWTHAPVVRGGVWPKAGRGNPPAETPDPSTPTPGASGKPQRKFDLEEFYKSKEFSAAEAEFGLDTRAIIEAAVDGARVGFTSGRLHKLRGSKENIWSLDLSSLGGGGGGRGKWRLILELGKNGTFTARSVSNTHKG